VKAVRAVKPGPQALSQIERDRLIRQVLKSENPRDIAVITLLVCTGLRISEKMTAQSCSGGSVGR
jgi:integrase